MITKKQFSSDLMALVFGGYSPAFGCSLRHVVGWKQMGVWADMEMVAEFGEELIIKTEGADRIAALTNRLESALKAIEIEERGDEVYISLQDFCEGKKGGGRADASVWTPDWRASSSTTEEK